MDDPKKLNEHDKEELIEDLQQSAAQLQWLYERYFAYEQRILEMEETIQELEHRFENETN